MSKRILVIEDDPDINKLVAMSLADANHNVDCCNDGAEGLQRALQHDYALLVLDLMLPGLDGLEVCRRLRAEQRTLPILMLTARDSEADRVVGLELGADDYLTKPFSVRELQARVKALLRRVEMLSQRSEPEALEIVIGQLVIDQQRRRVTVGGQEVELTATEFDLLLYLARQPGKVFSRTELLDAVWGYQHSGYEHTVNSHINRLRNKLEAEPSDPRYVLTVWGVGYKLCETAGAPC
ncbi:response regulator transcription factor [Aestuariirhabdus sp. Z084]|uniref:response regulator transcription factor n=1 Tax=Aestuariirhabdus haliotis TaxID=2918751 RepID=UPI00201B425B|nr:response regulator transcription factor [Aestuariirhabdus haliotis]MCL6416570.1 response regulator transcription factor [Aestuariirhabdus haliotis]MCL6420563.1 response regulator transcription factor [Aestuariirhabdus haliotis]